MYWFIPLFPTFLKRLMVWSGTNLSTNLMWAFMSYVELLALILGVMALGVFLGEKLADKEQKNFDKFKSDHLEKIRALYREHQDLVGPLEKKISGLEAKQENANWQIIELKNALDHERKRTTRTAEEANKEALRSLI